jgi:hypothetical protein
MTTTSETYTTAYAFVEAMHRRLKRLMLTDKTGRRIENVSDLVNCLNNGTLDPAALGRKKRAKQNG